MKVLSRKCKILLKDIYYIHDTPLAGLAAHLHVRPAEQGRAALLERLPFLDLPQHLIRAGTDGEGHTVYGIWMRKANPVLINRLLQGYFSVNDVPPDRYEIRIVPDRGHLALIAFLFKCGLYRAARRLLVRWGRLSMRHLVWAPGID